MFRQVLHSAALRRPLIAIAACAALVGCGGEVDVRPGASAPPPALPVVEPPTGSIPPPPSNSAPTISGTPPAGVTAGTAYSFVPNASDPDGGVITFSIANRPAWASFSIATGALTGTPPPDSVGNFDGIVISVSDGTAITALPPFSIAVQALRNNTGSAALFWVRPAENIDGSPLTDLAGYRIYHGNSADRLDQTVEIANPATTSYSMTGLASGTHYFALSAYTAGGIEGNRSAVASKTIP